MPHKVFISYKAEEFNEANWVKTVLEKNGISCWMAPMSIKGGSSYASEIPQAIRTCQVFVLILSEKAQQSKWVPKEVDQAINENKIIMPFMLENCLLQDDFNFYLTNIQRYVAYENKSKAIEKMIREIKAIVDVKEDEESETDNSDNQIAGSMDKEECLLEEPLKNEKKHTKPKKIKRISIKILIPIIIVIIAVLITSFVIMDNRSVTIGGEKFKTSISSLSFEEDGKKLTVEDIEKIMNLHELSSVNLDGCELPDNALCDLLQMDLYSLSLNNCGITDSDFKDLSVSEKSVRCLKLNDNEIENLNVLKPLLVCLNELYVDNNPITDLSSLKEFDLRTLSLNNVGLTDVAPIAEISELKELYINDNDIESLEAFNSCENLEIISVNNNKLVDFSGLEHSLKLKELYAENNSINSLKGLENTTVLTIVNLNNNVLDDISLLSKSKEVLTKLYVNNNNMNDISCLSECLNLKLLYIDNNSVSTLESLSDCVNLESISAANNNLLSATGLEKAVNISYVDLSDNSIHDISALTNIVVQSLTNYYFDLSNNQITDLALPLINYSFLNICGNEINDFSPILNCKISKLFFDYTDNIDYVSLSNNQFYNIYIVDCPLDKQLEIKKLLGEYNTNFIYAEEIESFVELK